jgi:hypothetical protein
MSPDPSTRPALLSILSHVKRGFATTTTRTENTREFLFSSTDIPVNPFCGIMVPNWLSDDWVPFSTLLFPIRLVSSSTDGDGGQPMTLTRAP